ncbi:polysaccharide export outer membrane protein [Novosphingobium sp. PhB57]|jgi:polysaccharide export outer membrane protein|uniref:polysaccharide biosynthesis/export family protein n=1 Tax=unclassified Novosphingobium TaxID=2644732 RepID=UPI001046ACE1|nr:MULTISPECIES: polysaccharide biosynthesis/export family protein [unclassified Novosphingobium]TCU62116.1 polysaccharide export outer membrane protein [Novosphingobium sp. PhB57]TDW62849.1 polysaccharide export outer membrane protein [Novosphingobium sp. PhB55]
MSHGLASLFRFRPLLAVPLAVSLISTSMLGGCSSPTASLPTLASTPAGAYKVGAGDKLHIVVQDLQSANGDYIVEDSGAISLPYIKQVDVAGLTYREIEQGIAASLLRQGIMTGDPVVNVGPVELRPFYVVGEVNKPGQFEYRQGMTVLAAISAAGGYTYRAQTGKVAVTRVVSGKDVTASADEMATIQPGDRIRVYERWF